MPEWLGDPAQFIAGMIEEGIGVTAGRNMVRDAGFQISNEAFGNLYGQVRFALGDREIIQGLNYDQVPPSDVYSTWRAGRGDQYATYVTSYVRPVGERDIEERFYFHLSDDPHTPQEAIDAAQAHLTGDRAATSGSDPIVLVGSVVTSVNRTIGRDDVF